jgi:serine protease AprX
LCLVLSLLSLSPAQPTRYLVYFQPKPDSLLPFVEAYLSPEALRRRYQQGIPIDVGDLPVPSAWIAQLGQHGRVMGVSRWLNAALVEVPVSSALPAAPFIRCVEPFTATQPRPKIPQESITGATHELISSLGASARTGSLTATQLSMLHIPELHDRNLRGRGIRVAVLDAGFSGYGPDSGPSSMSSERDGMWPGMTLLAVIRSSLMIIAMAPW